MITDPKIHQWITALQFLIDDPTTSDAVRSVAKNQLATFDKSRKLHDQDRQTVATALHELRTREKELRPRLIEQLQNSKRLTLDADVTQVEQLRTAFATLEMRSTIITQAHSHITSQLCGLILKPFADELLLWVAKRRDSDPVACGEIDALPAPVRLVYETIQPTWRNDWEPALTLGTTTRLPLIYDPYWDADYRASVAWVWSQVAHGLICKVPPLHHRNPNTQARAQLLAPTRRVNVLPTAPPVPLTPPTHRKLQNR